MLGLSPAQHAEFRAAVGASALLRLACLITWLLTKQPSNDIKTEEIAKGLLQRFPQLRDEFEHVEKAYKGGMPAMLVFTYAAQAVLEQTLPVVLDVDISEVH